MKLLRSLSSEWKTYTLIWRNKPDLETLSMDDLYNNLKIYKAEVMGSSSISQNTQNVAFVSSNITGNTNEAVKTAHGVSAANSKEMLLLYQIGDGLEVADGNADNESKKIYQEENKESRALKHQDNKKRETITRTMPVGETTSNALVSQCSSSSSNSDTEVSSCSKACLKSYENLKEHYDNLTKDFNKSQLNAGAYKVGLESVEARPDVYKKNKAIFKEDIKILKLDIMLRDNALTELKKILKKAEKEEMI
ncbi:hypothetical protein Tco_1506096 [Tanacetum coccineum]